MGTFVVKIQVNESKRQMLIYGQRYALTGSGFMRAGEPTKEVLRQLAGRLKAYFEVTTEGGTFTFVKEAPWQEW